MEIEKELALRSQLLDVAIIRRADEAGEPSELGLPDGLEGLRPINLVTFKSHHEPLNGWALDELLGHYVNYRKQVLRTAAEPPETEFGLYAVSVRFPRDLARDIRIEPAGQPGIFDVRWGLRHIRIIVASAVEGHPRNALWDMFSANTDRIRQGARHYRARHPDALALLERLYLSYRLEELNMPYTMEDFLKETRQMLRDHMTPEERRALIESFPAEERLRGLAPTERLRGLSDEDLRELKAQLDRLN